jgi:hypothetical protein
MDTVVPRSLVTVTLQQCGDIPWGSPRDGVAELVGLDYSRVCLSGSKASRVNSEMGTKDSRHPPLPLVDSLPHPPEFSSSLAELSTPPDPLRFVCYLLRSFAAHTLSRSQV